MEQRKKETISLDLLGELAKQKLKQPNCDHYMHEDLLVVIAQHVDFLEAVAQHTKRINPCSVALVGRDVFQLGKHESHQFGSALSSAFSHCIRSGSKATSGQKLSEEVVRVWVASLGAGGDDKLKVKVKREAMVKKEAVQEGLKQEPAASLKRERPSSSARPSKSLKVCLSSPSKIMKLYAGTLPSAASSSSGGSSSGVKVGHMCAHV